MKGSPYRETLDRCFDECKQLFAHNEWETLQSPHADVDLYVMTTPTGRTLKVTGLVEGVHHERLFQEVFNQGLEEKRRLGQSFLVEDHIIEELTCDPESAERAVLRRQQFKLVWPISNRETVVVRGGRLWDGKWVQFETSVDHPQYPVQSSPVRAVVNKACFVYEQLGANLVQATYIADVEMGGSIPAWLVAMGDTKACERILSFRRIASEKDLCGK